jgi:hypothetical protein
MKGKNKELKLKEELGKEMWRKNMRWEERQREAKKCN